MNTKEELNISLSKTILNIFKDKIKSFNNDNDKTVNLNQIVSIFLNNPTENIVQSLASVNIYLKFRADKQNYLQVIKGKNLNNLYFEPTETEISQAETELKDLKDIKHITTKELYLEQKKMPWGFSV